VAYNSGAASATPFAALSGANHKAPGFAGGYLLKLTLWIALSFVRGPTDATTPLRILIRTLVATNALERISIEWIREN
jgi:hypothetical protein